MFVSGSRPSVYCPLEIVVEEGETVTLDCEGADPLSFRMDYDEEAASVLWEWEGLWGTSTGPSRCDGAVVAVVYGACGQRGEGVPLHSEHDLFGLGHAPHGAAKSDGQSRGCGRTRLGACK